MGFFKKEIVYFLTALQFFTRIPVKRNLPYSEAIMNQSQKYYAWVGILIGGINALVLWLSLCIFPLDISLVLMMGANILLTGAFHEDGFTDVCDSFGGGYGKEKILTIMKDSRVGAYGVIGIVLLLLLKFFSLKNLGEIQYNIIFTAIILAHGISRFMSGLMIYTHDYVSDIDKSKSKPMANKALPWQTLLWSALAVVVSFFMFDTWAILWVILPCFLAKYLLGCYFKKYIGGYTGDCLGTVQQVVEVVAYLSVFVIWKYI